MHEFTPPSVFDGARISERLGRFQNDLADLQPPGGNIAIDADYIAGELVFITETWSNEVQ